MNGRSIAIAGEDVVLDPTAALYWPRERTLVVADAHFGKAAAFRRSGVFVPETTTDAALGRLDHLIDRYDATRIVFIGDFLHAKEGRHPETLANIERWRGRYSAIEMILVRGNHDRRAGDPPREFHMTCIEAPLLEPPFALAHHPVAVDNHYVLAGHIHPAVTLLGAAKQRARLPCFWFGERVGVLPAFGEFTGVATVEPATGDRVYVLTGDDVIEASEERS
ncbi:MAG TPA: ligase-associated DNA damage response endonuclease PdeM [Gemmatimonadaceae bacterium]|nr:ligase-associated DNA damage response endonuclease PdeM [Gemmatimonadaceae bacterium]